MTYKITLQKLSNAQPIPSRQRIQQWVKLSLQKQGVQGEITIRIVDNAESAQLNQTYRHKLGPTNVLSFPLELPPGIKMPLLGDLVLCAPLVIQEADQQNKTYDAHWAHLIIHGTLHLLGYDHLTEDEAHIMEAIEISLLQQLSFSNPYEG